MDNLAANRIEIKMGMKWGYFVVDWPALSQPHCLVQPEKVTVSQQQRVIVHHLWRHVSFLPLLQCLFLSFFFMICMPAKRFWRLLAFTSQNEKSIFIEKDLRQQQPNFIFSVLSVAVFPVPSSVRKMGSVMSAGTRDKCSHRFKAGPALVFTLKKHSTTRADRPGRESVVGDGGRVVSLQTERVSGGHRQVISHPRRGPKLQIQQSWIQMMMTAMDAPGWFLHEAIPPHQLLRGRVQPSQHNTDKNVAVWPPRCALLFHSSPWSEGECAFERKRERESAGVKDKDKAGGNRKGILVGRTHSLCVSPSCSSCCSSTWRSTSGILGPDIKLHFQFSLTISSTKAGLRHAAVYGFQMRADLIFPRTRAGIARSRHERRLILSGDRIYFTEALGRGLF